MIYAFTHIIAICGFNTAVLSCLFAAQFVRLLERWRAAGSTPSRSTELNGFRLDLEHQICQFHVRRWVGRTLKELSKSLPQEWLWVIDEIQKLITELPLEGSKRLYELWKQIPLGRRGRMHQPLSALDQLRQLLLRLSEHWPQYRVFDWQPDVPWTNNGTEQVIGRMKMRSRTVRGYKTQPGLLNGLMLAGTSLG